MTSYTADCVRLGLLPPGLLPALLPYWAICTTNHCDLVELGIVLDVLPCVKLIYQCYLTTYLTYLKGCCICCLQHLFRWVRGLTSPAILPTLCPLRNTSALHVCGMNGCTLVAVTPNAHHCPQSSVPPWNLGSCGTPLSLQRLREPLLYLGSTSAIRPYLTRVHKAISYAPNPTPGRLSHRLPYIIRSVQP